MNIRIKNLQTPREIRFFKACILFAALERFPSDKKSPNFKTPGCGQPHQKSCVDFSGRGSNRQKEKCTVRPLCFLPQCNRILLNRRFYDTVLFYFSAEEVLVGKLQKVLELLNRIIFSAAPEIRAYYIMMYLQDWGEKLKIIFQNCSPILID